MVRKRRGDRLPPFVALTWELLNSKAYKDLPSSPAKALPHFLGKVKTGFNDSQRYLTEFPFSYSEAEKLGFAPSTFSKVIQSLIATGFLDPINKGGLRGECKSVSVFKLSRRWEIYGKPEFKKLDWKCFIPKKRD